MNLMPSDSLHDAALAATLGLVASIGAGLAEATVGKVSVEVSTNGNPGTGTCGGVGMDTEAGAAGLSEGDLSQSFGKKKKSGEHIVWKHYSFNDCIDIAQALNTVLANQDPHAVETVPSAQVPTMITFVFRLVSLAAHEPILRPHALLTVLTVLASTLRDERVVATLADPSNARSYGFGQVVDVLYQLINGVALGLVSADPSAVPQEFNGEKGLFSLSFFFFFSQNVHPLLPSSPPTDAHSYTPFTHTIYLTSVLTSSMGPSGFIHDLTP